MNLETIITDIYLYGVESAFTNDSPPLTEIIEKYTKVINEMAT